MSLSITPSTVLVAVVSFLIAYLANVWYTWRKLSHVPGPTWAGFTKLWMVSQSFQRRQPYAFMEANNKYGTVVQMSLDCPAYMISRLIGPCWTERGYDQ